MVLKAQDWVRVSQEHWVFHQGFPPTLWGPQRPGALGRGWRLWFLPSFLLLFLPSRYFPFFSFGPNIKVVGRIQLLVGGGGKTEVHPLAQLSLVAEGRSCSPCQITGATRILQVGLMALGVLTGRGWACGFVCLTFRQPGLSHVIYGYSRLPSKDRVRLLTRQPPASIWCKQDSPVFKKIIFVYLTALGLSGSMWDLWSLVVAYELLIFAACGI